MLATRLFKRLIGTQIEPKEVQVKVPWGHIAVKQWGELSQPFVICCHGFLDNAGSFDKLIPLLPKRFCYLAMDYPGHGFSSPTHDGMVYTDDLYNESVCRVQRHFAGNEKIGVIGHSMGAALSVRYNLTSPEAMSFLIAMELPCFPLNPIVERIRHVGRRIDKIMKQFKYKEPARTKEELLKGVVIGWGGSLDNEAAEILMKRGMMSVGDNKWKLSRHIPCGNNQVFGINHDSYFMYDQPKQDFSFCAIEFLSGIRFHTTGLLERNLQTYANMCKLTEYHALRGSHHLLLTQPQKVSGIVSEFMNRAAP